MDLGIGKERIGFVEEYHKYYYLEHVEILDKNTLNIYAHGIMAQCKNDIEYMIAQEIFAGEEYGFHTNNKYFVIDIGMNIGCATLYFASKDNVTAVYGFEPCVEVYEEAVINIEKNDEKIRKKIAAYNIGLGKEDCIEQYMAHSGIMVSGGIKKVQDGVGQGNHIIALEVRKTSSILANIFMNHSESCLLKMDCEGAEYDILEDLINSGIIKKIDVICMEWHDGKYKQLESLMERAGFQYFLNKGSNNYGKCYAWR